MQQKKRSAVTNCVSRYDVTLRALFQELRITAQLLVNMIRLLVRMLEEHPQRPLQLTRAERKSVFLDRLNAHYAIGSNDDEQCRRIADVCYDFYSSRIVERILTPSSMSSFSPPLSINVRSSNENEAPTRSDFPNHAGRFFLWRGRLRSSGETLVGCRQTWLL